MFPNQAFSYPAAQANTEERRIAGRFPIARELRFRVTNKKYNHEQGAGRTLNISSTGILFETDQRLVPGRRVEIALNWPAQLDNKTALKMVARGKVIRYDKGVAAVEILQHEFRTAGGSSGGQ